MASVIPFTPATVRVFRFGQWVTACSTRMLEIWGNKKQTSQPTIGSGRKFEMERPQNNSHVTNARYFTTVTIDFVLEGKQEEGDEVLLAGYRVPLPGM